MMKILNRSIKYFKDNSRQNLFVSLILVIFIGLMATSSNIIGIVTNQNIDREAEDLQRMYFSYADEIKYDNDNDEAYLEQQKKLNDPDKIKQIEQLDWVVSKSEFGSIHSGNDLIIENAPNNNDYELMGVNDYKLENFMYSYTEDSMEFSPEQINSGEFVMIIPQYLIDNGTYSVGQKINVDFFLSLKENEGLIGNYSQEFEIIGGYDIEIDDEIKKEIEQEFDGNTEGYIEMMLSSYYIPFQTFDSIITELENDPGYQSFLNIQSTNSNEIYESDIFYENTSLIISGLIEPNDPQALSDLESIYGDEMSMELLGDVADMDYTLKSFVLVMVYTIIVFGTMMSFVLGKMIFSSVKKREKEFEILLLVGENKKSIYLQILTEIFLLAIPISIVMIPVSYFMASILTKVLFNTVLYIEQGYVMVSSQFDFFINLGIIVLVVIIILIAALNPCLYILKIKKNKNN